MCVYVLSQCSFGRSQRTNAVNVVQLATVELLSDVRRTVIDCTRVTGAAVVAPRRTPRPVHQDHVAVHMLWSFKSPLSMIIHHGVTSAFEELYDIILKCLTVY